MNATIVLSLVLVIMTTMIMIDNLFLTMKYKDVLEKYYILLQKFDKERARIKIKDEEIPEFFKDLKHSLKRNKNVEVKELKYETIISYEDYPKSLKIKDNEKNKDFKKKIILKEE